MIVELKLMLPPLVGVVFVVANVISDFPDAVRLTLDVVALAILFAGVLVVGKLRAENAALKGAAEAWELERNAERAKSERLEAELFSARAEITELRVEMTKLEARPTLETVSLQIDQLRALMTQTAETVQQIVQSGQTSMVEGST